MSLREAIDTAVLGREVPGELLEAAFGEIMEGKASDALIAALLVALRAKGETVGEIVAAARALRAAAVTVPGVDPRAIDTCGTGGDGAETFNISTAAAFVVAGAGTPVAKHGNRAASSRTGSVDVLEALGVCVDLSVEASARILADVGIAPFFARIAHPAMANVAPVRRELGFRTVMNCLGPLVNPVRVRLQLVGVYGPALLEPIARALGELGALRALVVHGSDGLDEVTTRGTTHAALLAEGEVRLLVIDPTEHGIAAPAAEAIRGGDAVENAAIIERVLGGEAGPCRDIVQLNAAAALWVAGAAEDLRSGLALAGRSIDSGAARERLAALGEATRAAAK
ncbi:MAG: anthranilate phosphoribosyltransferase [Myxococcota bacterium]